MAIPKTLFHGTSAYRARFIDAMGLKKGQPKGLEYTNGDGTKKGYCYFTDSFNEACGYAIQQVIVDEHTPKGKIFKEEKVWLSIGCIFALRTSHVRDKLSIDPEQDYYNQQLYKAFSDIVLEDVRRNQGTWYRYKGDVSTKYLSNYRYIPLGDNSARAIELETIIELQMQNGILKIPEGFDLP